ncbi:MULTISPECIES: MerR family transcriptional regulator [Actinokineospora]|uniref:MerR family transcriptional regulator n=1 Tax=Actinokineospora fastidiosa TaxID=1816 RepID=A0A918LAP6_9PSEU|nr:MULTISPECIES: MerR family transcriptional regulator [Actinokineospora]UVS81895.1 Mercuric resistance operon regulatory protein [Actinokineospora sp. UTMC 2448]GGS24996.1 MerR family transcriptional regulator [Actinokineospora fastidiosa]
MRIAELSRATGVPVPTIKFYLREGVLPAGERTGRNQARYDDGHVRRLRLIRAMVDLGGLSLATVGEIIAAVDSPDEDRDHLMGQVSKSLINAPDEVDPDAQAEAEGVLARLGWTDACQHPSVRTLAAVIAAARDLGHDLTPNLIEYGHACEAVAAADLDYVSGMDVDRMLESVVVGTLLGDTALLALRRLAQTVESHKRYGGTDDQPAGDH